MTDLSRDSLWQVRMHDTTVYDKQKMHISVLLRNTKLTRTSVQNDSTVEYKWRKLLQIAQSQIEQLAESQTQTV